jgi:hypothetical protein
MTKQWSDERLDAALRELLRTRADEIGAMAPTVDRVSAQLADQLGVTARRRRSGRRAWRNGFMSNTLKVALAGAAALLIAVVGIGLYFNQPGGVGTPAPSPSPTLAPTLLPTAEPAPETASPVEIAQAYIEARNAYDPERARQLLADNFTTTEPPDGFRDLSTLELAFVNHKAWGFQHSLSDCREREQAASPELAVVECDSLWTTAVHRHGDHPPTPETFLFRIRDGRIVSVIHDASDFGWFFGPGSFYDGFLSEHLEFRELMDDSFNLEPEATREVLERLPQYFELYEDWVALGSTPRLSSGDLEPGTYALDSPDFPVRITFDVPDGWRGAPGREAAGVWKPTAGLPDLSIMVAFWVVALVSEDPCGTDSMALAGSSVDDLATVIASWPEFETTGPTDVTLDGYEGTTLEFTVPDDSEQCVGGDFDMWRSGGITRGANEGNHSQLWILDVDGTRLVVEVVDSPGGSDQDRAESLQIFESIQIEKP